MTVQYRELLNTVTAELEAADLFYGHGTESAGQEAQWLLAHVLDLDPRMPVEDTARLIAPDELTRAKTLVERRVQTRKPLAYLINSAWFCGLEFYVDERVIIPRSPIAELIGRGFSPWLAHSPRRVLDLCTGGGCIAVACALAFPDAVVDAADISAGALDVAAINIRRHDLQSRIELHQADVFDGLPETRYDLIVSNPPYVDAGDMADLPVEYRHEPSLALAAGTDGLAVVGRILREAADYLSPRGTLVCEVGNSQAALEQAFPRLAFTWVELEEGGHGLFVVTADELKAAAANLR